MILYCPEIMRIAFAHVYSLNVGLTDEETGSRWHTALEKARKRLETNKTISFDGVKLAFTSEKSGLRRIVTKDGCSQYCCCQNGIGYHKALFALVSYYKELEPKRDKIKILNGEIERIYRRDNSGSLVQTAENVCGINVWKKAPKTQKYATRMEAA